jgi:hypothetical protein
MDAPPINPEAAFLRRPGDPQIAPTLTIMANAGGSRSTWSAATLIEGPRRDSLKTSLQRSLQSGRYA